MGKLFSDSGKKTWNWLPHHVQNYVIWSAVTLLLSVIFRRDAAAVLVIMVAQAIFTHELARWGHEHDHAWVKTMKKGVDKALDRERKPSGAAWADRRSDLSELIPKHGEPGWLTLGSVEVER